MTEHGPSPGKPPVPGRSPYSWPVMDQLRACPMPGCEVMGYTEGLAEHIRRTHPEPVALTDLTTAKYIP